MIAPTLQTARLTLRPQAMADFPAYAAFLASDRASFMGGPIPASRAWDWFCSDVAQWELSGWGGLVVIDTASGRTVGQVTIAQPPHFPETELGWFAMADGEGRGLIKEAATAMRDWAFGPRGLKTLVSYVDHANARSIRLAERLGATRDASASTPHGNDCLVFRHSPGERA